MINQSNKQAFGGDIRLNLQVINHFDDNCGEYQIGRYPVFIDYKKTFACLKHSFLFTSLQEQEVPSTCLNIIADIFKNNAARILLEETRQLL